MLLVPQFVTVHSSSHSLLYCHPKMTQGLSRFLFMVSSIYPALDADAADHFESQNDSQELLHDTHDPSYRLMTVFWELRSRTVSKSFADFQGKIAVRVHRRLHVMSCPRTLPCRPSFRAVSGLSRRQREEVIKSSPLLRLGGGDGIRTHTPFRITNSLANCFLTS